MRKAALFLFFFLLAPPGYCVSPPEGATAPAVSMKPPAPQDIPYRRDDPITTSLIVRVAASLVLVLLMAAGVIYLMKRYMPGWRIAGFDKSSRISVLETKRLTPRTFLFLIQVDGRTLLLAQSNDRITALNLTGNTAPAPDAATHAGP